ncbi:MAG: hypothetical protein VX951_08810 [Planctomycetota bacterium]|nr:hypothetical protein [Planctomycetota bacterium]
MSKLKVDTVEVNTANTLQLGSNTQVVAENGSAKTLTVSGATTLEGLLTIQAGASITGNITAVNTPNLGTSNAKLGTIHATSVTATSGNFDSINISSQNVGIVLGHCLLETYGSGVNRGIRAKAGTAVGVCLNMQSTAGISTIETVNFSSAFGDVNEYRLIYTPRLGIPGDGTGKPFVALKSNDAAGVTFERLVVANSGTEVGTLVVLKS